MRVARHQILCGSLKWTCYTFWIIPIIIIIIIISCGSCAQALVEIPEEHVQHTIISGVPFDITLPEGAEIASTLPQCMVLLMRPNETEQRSPRWHLRGLCLLTDVNNSPDTRETIMNRIDPYANVLRNLTFVQSRGNVVTNLALSLQLEAAIFLPVSVSSYISLPSLAGNESVLREPLSCHRRAPTVAIVHIQGDFSALNTSARCVLWRHLTEDLLTNRISSVYPAPDNRSDEQDCTGKAYLRVGFRLLSMPDMLYNNLLVLASASAQLRPHVDAHGSDQTFGFMYRIGCGSISSDALKILASLEKLFHDGPIRLGDGTLSDRGQILNKFQITKWTVGDLIAPQTHHALARATRAIEPMSEPDPIVTQVAGLLDEGSGLLPTYRLSGPGSQATFYPTFDGFPKSAPRLQPISPVKITVHQITNVQFPPKTFEKFPDVTNTNLLVTLYQPELGNLTEPEIRSPNTPVERFGRVVSRDTRKWISFDPKSKIVRLRPLPQHVGNHQLILCAVAPSHLRACEPFYVTVRRPAPFRKNFILRIQPGIYWCYRIPIYWFEELKATSFENLELSVNGDSPFSWDVQSAEICVVTMLRAEQIITLFFHASNNQIAQSVEIEFRLSAKVPAVQRMISSSRLRLSLQWPKEAKSYQLQELNRINASLAQVLRVRVNPEVTDFHLFIYDIIHFFSAANDSSTARLELEWVFLPQGLPVDLDRDTVGHDLGQLRQIPRVGTLSGHQTSYLDRPSGLITLPELLKLCKSASLDGAEAALKATGDSFRPFKLEAVSLLELENSACHKAKQFTGRNSAGGSSLSTWGVGETANVRLMPDVISNFTVTAGVSFKKTINPEKATPLKRIQFMELVDIRGTKLGDTAWLGLTSDNSRLFGLPLKHHIRKQPYMFSLQIYSVDQKTPISVGFTVEVQDWFGADADAQSADTAPGRLPNHRVRLRIMPTTTGTNWGVEPIHSLDYRWHLSTAIDKFLRPHCPPPCNPDVGIWELNKHADSNAIFVVWAQLSLLMENSKLDGKSQGSGSYSLDSSTTAQSVCPWEKLNRLQNLLTFAPSVVSVEKNLGLVTGYTNNGQIFLAPWAAPSAPFRNHLATAGLGTVEAAVVDRMGVCARGLEDKLDAQAQISAGTRKSGLAMNGSSTSIQTFTIYTGECFRYKIPAAENLKHIVKDELHLFDIMGQRIGTSSWIGLEEDKVTVYGILMGNAVQPITYRFRIASSTTAPDGVTFAVHVAGSNPLLPAVYNHRVIMRFGTEGGQRWAGGHSLADRWRLVSALDAFLRPQCATDPTCKENMDVLLLTFNYQANGFTVIWSEKSLLMKTSSEPGSATTTEINSLREHWNKWSKRQTSRRHRKRSEPRSANGSSLPMSTRSVHDRRERSAPSSGSTSSVVSCPERDIVYLERRLLGDTGFGLLPLPELAHHLKASGVGFLKEVQVERLGPCAKSLVDVPLYIPEPGVPVKISHSNDPGTQPSPVYMAGVSSFGPVQKTKDRQRLVLLGTILPVCVGVICILLGVLGYVWYRKRGKKTTDARQEMDSKLVSHAPSINNPETERMLKQEKEPFKQNDMVLNSRDGMGTLNMRTQVNGSGPRPSNYSEMIQSNSTPPTKPLILPNERPPLKPPEYNLAYTESPATSPPQFHNGTPQMAASPFPTMMNPNVMAVPSPRPMPKPYYGTRPNPYRNLPPPIENKPGMPSIAAQIPFAPYKRVIGMQHDMSNTLPG